MVTDYARAPGPGRGAQTQRGEQRRGLILEVAAGMFARRGYDGVSINDIGIAAGVTGPAIYRYFPGKEDMLVSIWQHLYEQSRQGTEAIVAGSATAAEKLEQLVALQIDLAAGQPEKIRIVDSLERHLPADAAKAFRDQRRAILKAWSGLVGQVRPDLRPDERDVTIHAVLALINSISLRRSSERAQPHLCAHLQAMAMDALAAG
jgi:AcrR family transcriptional regulator